MTLRFAVGLLMIVLGGCDTAPSEPRRADDVARLERLVVPVVAELGVRFYLDESSCYSLHYPPGEFRDGDARCISNSESFGRFDDAVRRDFDRIRSAMEASGVNTIRFDASVNPSGGVRHVAFRIVDSSIQWNWFYLYDPTNAVPKGGQSLNAPRYERINANWWLVTEVDD